MNQEFKIACRDGEMTYVYDDKLAPLSQIEGQIVTQRASHVEPAADGGWIADMRPVGGPVLTGFSLRQEALDAEKEWLDVNIIDPGSQISVDIDFADVERRVLEELTPDDQG